MRSLDEWAWNAAACLLIGGGLALLAWSVVEVALAAALAAALVVAF